MKHGHRHGHRTRHGHGHVDTGFEEMELQQSRVDVFEKFTWKIENFSHLNNEKLYSEPVILGGYPWRILLYPRGNKERGNKEEDLSIYLDAVQSANMSTGWSRHVTFRLFVFNQVDDNMTITKESDHKFNAEESDWGFTSLIPLAEFRDPSKGFLADDACIVGLEVSVHKSRHENQVNQAASLTLSLTSRGQCGTKEVEVPSPDPISKNIDVDLFSASIGELMDFRGLGQIEKAFVPLLEEVCSQHPSLIECQQKRSRKFTEWAFTALGRVLYFLKTRKGKDMNDLACEDLQILWEELETCRFDLTWLEPHVQSALRMKSYVEKAIEVQKLKENVVALELEVGSLKAKLVTTEVNLDAARDFLKAKDFKEIDLDAELGYGIP